MALPICSVPRFRIDFYLSTTTKKLKFTDIIAGDYNTVHGQVLANIKGLIKVTAPNGVIYVNAGYEANDFSSPDIDGNTLTWNVDDIALPLDEDGNVQTGTYTFEYKISFDGGSTQCATITKTYDYDFTKPNVVIDTTHSCKTSKMEAVDMTDYTVTVDSVEIDPTNDLGTDRDLTIQYPLTSGQSDVTVHTQTNTIGPNIWTGSYNISVDTDLVYDLEDWSSVPWFTVNITVKGEEAHEVECDNCACEVVACVKNIKDRKEDALIEGYTQTYNTLNKTLQSIVENWMLYQIFERCGYDSTEFCNNIKELAFTNDCGCTTTDDASVEVIPWALATASVSLTGTQIHSGIGAPAAGLGNTDDYYIRTDTGSLYKKVTGTWTIIMSMVGPTGAAGASVVILENNISDDGTTAGTLEETLKTYTLLGNTMDGDGDMIHIVSLLQLAQNSNGKKIKLYFGSLVSTYYTTTTVTATNNIVRMEAWVNRTGAITQFIEAQKIRSGSPNKINGPVISTDIQHLTSDVIIKVTGQNDVASANDIICKQLRVELLPKI